MSFVQTEQIRGEGDSSIFKNLCSGTTFALFGVSLSIFLPARNNVSCFPGYLMPISSYYNLLCLLYSLTAWNIQDKYCSEDDDTLCREFVGADIKHVWGSRSLEIRDEDLWPKSRFLWVSRSAEERCGGWEQTTDTLSSLKYHRLGLDEGTLLRAVAEEQLKAQEVESGGFGCSGSISG